MPRDGSGNYTYPPGTPGIPDTTIESAKYNGYIADIQQDLNLPRPVVAGGTGANNATAARANLQAEVAAVLVTNYDSQVWETGSFRSGVGATSSPAPASNVAGVCIVSGPNDVMLRAYDAGNGIGYLRIKSGGVWGTWVSDESKTDARYVNVTGDTMTGNLTVPQLIATDRVQFSTDTNFYAKQIGPDPHYLLGGAGNRYIVHRAATGFLDFVNNGTSYLTVNNAGSPTFPLGATFTGLSGFNGGAYFGNDTNFFINDIGASRVLRFQNGWQLQFDEASGLLTWFGVDASQMKHRFWYNGDYQIAGTAASKVGAGQWADSSDARIKTVTGNYTSGLDEIKTLTPRTFTYKGNELQAPLQSKDGAAIDLKDVKDAASPDNRSTHYQAAVDQKEFIGLIAQEVEATFPEMITQSPALIDGKLVTDLRAIDPTALTYALINAVKTLAARIEALEAAQATP